jgi:hypothetical protein
MKTLLAALMCSILLSIAAIPAAAQNPIGQSSTDTQTTQRQYDDYGYHDRSLWGKHRDKITTAGGAVGGAILGGLIGGRKGAAIGAITGGGGAAIYTYRIRNKGRRY